MDENPYQSPLADEKRQSLVLFWRRIFSLPLIIFGAGYAFALPAAVVEFSVGGSTGLLLISPVISAAGAGMLWLGLRLRRGA